MNKPGDAGDVNAPFPDGDPIMVIGMRVIECSHLPEGVLIFKRQGKTIGIIDNRGGR